jgi:hypothetical protein
VSDQHGRHIAEGFDQLDDILGDDGDAIVGDAARLGRVAVAAQVGRDRAEAGIREGGELPPPRRARFGEAVEEDDQRAVPLRIELQLRRVSPCRD